MGFITRALGAESYDAVQLDSTIETNAGDVRGTLLEVVPNLDNNGPESMESVYERTHDPQSGAINAFEIWFHKGETRFFLLADTDPAAHSLRKRVINNYPDSRVDTVRDSDVGMPTIEADDYVSGAFIGTSHPEYDSAYLPVGMYDDAQSWPPELNPIAEVISSMQGGEETSVVVQGVLEPLDDTWTNQSVPFIDESVHEFKDAVSGLGDGWLTSFADKKTRQRAVFNMNLRVMAISPRAEEATTRVRDVAQMFERDFKSECGKSFDATPINAVRSGKQRSKMQSFITRVRQRQIHTPTSIIMSAKEATALHVPQEEAGVSGLNVIRSSAGGEVPVDRPRHHDLSDVDLALAEDSPSDEGDA